ncbi:TolC family protein [Larkinella harenae]
MLPADTIAVSRQQAEQLFLTQNLQLLAEKLNISQADARILQAKVWPNPSLTVDQVNFWAFPYQTGGETVSPPLIGRRFGRNQQFAFQIDQLIQTAGKRKKLVAIEAVGRERAEQYFMDLLLSLKAEFRNSLTDLSFHQQYADLLRQQLPLLADLIRGQQRQVQSGNISQAELFRLKALELELLSDLRERSTTINQVQQELKTLLALPATSYLRLTDPGVIPDYTALKTVGFTALSEKMLEQSPRLRAGRTEVDFAKATHQYERAQRKPDLTASVAYDRNGNTMLDFVGFGVSVDLPFFNRNQGNIRASQLEIEKNQLQLTHTTNNLQNQLFKAYADFQSAADFYERLDVDYTRNLDELIQGVTRNFQRKNLSLLEFLNYFEAFRDNKQTLLEATKNLQNNLEELNYLTGTDLL